MISPIIVVVDELADAELELTRQVIVFEQDAVLNRAEIAFDLALTHWMVRPAADMADAFVLKPVIKFSGDVGCRRVALRMSRTVFSALSGTRLLDCLIVAPRQG